MRQEQIERNQEITGRYFWDRNVVNVRGRFYGDTERIRAQVVIND